MNCPSCDNPMGCDEPRIGYQVYICEDCNVLKQYHDGALVYESMPEAPMKPAERI